MHDKYVQKILEQTCQDYNLIAEQYTSTRSYVPGDVLKLSEYINSGDKVLDSGCANARLYPIIKEKGAKYVGIDVSESLIDISKNLYPDGEFRVMNSLNMDFDDEVFDKVLSVSVLHHIPSDKLRKKYLLEINRVLKKRGLILLRVQDLISNQKYRTLILKYFVLKLVGWNKMDFGDLLIPWKDGQGNILAERYFHCFSKKELKELFKKAGFDIEKVYYDGKDPFFNIYVIARKP